MIIRRIRWQDIDLIPAPRCSILPEQREEVIYAYDLRDYYRSIGDDRRADYIDKRLLDKETFVRAW